MGRKGKSVLEVLQDFSEDFTLIDDSLLLCRFCKTVVNWRKRTRIQEHMATKMHVDRKAAAVRAEGGGDVAAEVRQHILRQQQQHDDG